MLFSKSVSEVGEARSYPDDGYLPNAGQEAGRCDAERTRNLHDIEQADVSFSPLDSANVRPMKISLFRKPLLR